MVSLARVGKGVRYDTVEVSGEYRQQIKDFGTSTIIAQCETVDEAENVATELLKDAPRACFVIFDDEKRVLKTVVDSAAIERDDSRRELYWKLPMICICLPAFVAGTIGIFTFSILLGIISILLVAGAIFGVLFAADNPIQAFLILSTPAVLITLILPLSPTFRPVNDEVKRQVIPLSSD